MRDVASFHNLYHFRDGSHRSSETSARPRAAAFTIAGCETPSAAAIHVAGIPSRSRAMTEIASRAVACADRQVEMVAHQAPRVNDRSAVRADLLETREETIPSPGVDEDRRSLDPTDHDVMENSWSVEPRTERQAGDVRQPLTSVKL
jgi:hypothetical protein